VLRRIRADEDFLQMPEILLSAKGRPMDRETGLEIGADDYIVKPFSPRRLLEKIQNLLERERLSQVSNY
jgi:two-component system phosphate regulon response regulator PhoB